jgi:hypothetical protein
MFWSIPTHKFHIFITFYCYGVVECMTVNYILVGKDVS